MVATTLRRGAAAVIGYNTGQTDVNGTTLDSLEFVILSPIGSGTTIFFTDRAWNGSAFVAGGSDGTLTFTAATDLPAYTVISVVFSGGNATITVNGVSSVVSAGGFNPEEGGDTIYVYQGSDANTPTTFLSGIEIGDGNSTFSGNLAGTGLTAGVDAVGIAFDSATYHGPTTEAFAHLYNGESLFDNIMDASNWPGDDATAGGTPRALDQPNHSGPYNIAPNFSLWSAAGGGGGGIVHVGGDPLVGSGAAGYNLTQLFNNLLVGGITQFWGPKDITFDTVHGKFFLVDSDGTGGHNRVLQGNISDLLGNPTALPTLTVLYNDPGTAIASLITNIEVDPQNGIVYFTQGAEFKKLVYNTANQAATVLANFGTGSGNPNGTTNNTFDDFVINFSNGNVYLSSHRIIAAQDGDQVTRNYVYRISGLDPADGAGAFTFGNGLITVLPMSPDDDDANNGINFAAGEGFPQEIGTVEGLALSADGNTLYIAAAKTLYDHDGDGGVIGGPGTDPILTPGGIYAYALTGNPTGVFTTIYVPIDDGNDGSQAINPANGPQGLLDDLEIDPVTGHLYFVDLTGDQIGISNPPGDEGVWRIDLDGTPNAVFFQGINNVDALSASSLFLNRAPNVVSSTQATPGVTEASSAPGSGLTALVQPFLTLDVTDFETADQTDQLAGAVVRISNNYQDGATHDDRLTINGTTSGTLDFGAQDIAYSYNGATGVMTLTGPSTFNNYEAAIALVRFNTSGDDVTAFGAATTRTIAWSVSDGLNHSDEVSTTVTVTGINDAPVNTVGGAATATEDAAGNAAGTPPVNPITGISVFDVDADPATQDITVTLTVGVGTLTIRTDVTGGLAAGEVTGNGTATLVLTGTQNQINATLAAVNGTAQPNGLVYTPPAEYNGATTLTVTTNDGGFNGNDPGNSGTGTSEQDSDVKTINVTAVNDAPTVTDATQAAATILEDIPSAAGETVLSLFNASFSDALDQQQTGGNPTGSVANTLAGIVVIANGSSGATGQWQYFNGATWVDIGPASLASGQFINAGTAIRFNPALNFNGTAPTLTVHLADSSGGAIADGADINLSAGGATGGTTRYSTGTVVLSQDVTPVNDAPTSTNLSADVATWTEGGSATLLDVGTNATIADVDSANFDTGTLTVAITGALAQDGLFIETAGGVTTGAGTVSVSGTQIATFTGGGYGGGPLVFTFDADATPAAVQALVRAISYNNNAGDNPTEGARTVTWTLIDGDGTLNGGDESLDVTTTVNVVGINDAPAGTDATITINEDNTHVFTAANFGFSDIDGDNFAGVVITTLPASGTLSLNGNPILVAGTFVSATDIGNNLLTYLPGLDGNGDTYASFTFQVRDDGGTAGGGQNTDQSANTITFDVDPVNDSPVIDLNGAGGGTSVTTGYTENGAPTAIAPAATVSDVDSANFDGGHLVVAYTANGHADDRLTIINQGTGPGQISVVGGDIFYEGATLIGTFTGGTGTTALDITLNANATPAIVQALARAIAYSNVSEDPTIGDRGLSFTLSDGDGNLNGGDDTDVANATIQVTSVNDAPSGADRTVTISEDDPYTFLVSDFGFTDTDNDGFLAVKISSLPADGKIKLNGVDVILNQVISVTDINAGNLTFVPDLDEFNTPYTTFTFQVQDDGGILNGGVDLDPSANNFTFNVTADNFDPDVTVTDTLAYTENDAATVIAPNATVTDSDSADFDGGTLTVSFDVNGTAADQLGIRNQGIAAGEIGVSGANVTYGGTVIGTYGGGVNGADLVVSLNASATPAAVQALMRNITYANSSDDPSVLARTVNFEVTDGDGGLDSANATVNVTAIDDEPGLVATAQNPTFTEDGAAADLFSAVTASTVEAGQTFASMTLTVTNVTDGANEILSFDGSNVALTNGNSVVGTATNGLTVNVTVVGSTATVTFSGAALSPAQLQILVDGLAYTNSSQNPTDASRVVTITALVDSGSNVAPNDNVVALSVASTVNVDPANDAASITGSAAGDVTEAGGTANGTPGTPTATGDLDSTDVDNPNDTWQPVVAGANSIGGYGTYEVNAAGVWVYTLDDSDPAVQALNGAATLTDTFNVVTGDGTAQLVTITIHAQDDAGTANDDALNTDEATAITGGNLFADNGGGADTDPDNTPTITAVNGSGGNVGTQITLASGALLTVNADGTFSYDPNGAFDATPTGGSGASNTPATDSFTYTLAGGDTATVTVTLTGLDTDDILFGTAGADSFAGGGGNDLYHVDHAGDAVVELNGGGDDRILTSVGYMLGGNAYVETLEAAAGTAAINLIGNYLVQTLIGNEGNNVLHGAGAADTLIGLGGNDIYYADVAGVTIVEAGGGGNDALYVSISYALDGNAEVETLSTNSHAGTTAINLTGNYLNNLIQGNNGANVLHGAGGIDTLVGFGGNDVYYTDVAATQVLENIGGGNDVVYTSVSYVLTAGSEVETLSTNSHAATVAIDLTGNSFANILFGNAGANVLDGKGGNDLLVGLAGADTFQFTTALGAGNVDIISSFEAGIDEIALDDAIFTGLAPGALDPGAFVTGAAAADANDRIIYNSATGQLFYDADGNGAGAAVQFATMEIGLSLTASDFSVI